MKTIWQVIGLRRSLIIATVVGLLVGCLFGWMVMGWLVVPVQWELAPVEKEQCVLMVADSYALNRDAKLARARLLHLADLEDEEIGQIIARLAANRPLQEQQNLLSLSLGLGLGLKAILPDAATVEEIPTLVPPAVAATPHPTNTPVPDDTRTPTLLPEAPSCTTRVGMNIRGGPGTDYPNIGDIPAGTTVGVIGQNFRQNVVWWKVGEDDSWVSGKYCIGNKETEKVEFVPAPPMAMPPPPPQPPMDTPTPLPPLPPTDTPTATLPPPPTDTPKPMGTPTLTLPPEPTPTPLPTPLPTPTTTPTPMETPTPTLPPEATDTPKPMGTPTLPLTPTPTDMPVVPP